MFCADFKLCKHYPWNLNMGEFDFYVVWRVCSNPVVCDDWREYVGCVGRLVLATVLLLMRNEA